VGFVHEFVAAGLRSSAGEALLHSTAWYSLQAIPSADASAGKQ
jgi:hypothetical protein